MSIGFIASTSIVGPLDGGTSAAINTTSATLLVVGANAFNPVTLTDSKGNVWNTTFQVVSGVDGNVSSRILYATPFPTVGTGHTFTYVNVGGFPAPAVFIGAFSGFQASGFVDGDVGTTSTSGFSTSLTSNPVTTTFNGDLIFVNVGLGDPSLAATSPTISGYTSMGSTPWVPGVNVGGAAFWAIQSVAGLTQPTVNWTNAVANRTMNLAAFVPAPGGGGSVLNRRTLGSRVGSRSVY